jgi:hypothetical protein
MRTWRVAAVKCARMAASDKKPLQIYLHLDQERVLRAIAKRDHVSLAELIRRSIDRYLTDLVPPAQDPSLGLIGLSHSGPANLSTRHDELMAEQAGLPRQRIRGS